MGALPVDSIPLHGFIFIYFYSPPNTIRMQLFVKTKEKVVAAFFFLVLPCSFIFLPVLARLMLILKIDKSLFVDH